MKEDYAHMARYLSNIIEEMELAFKDCRREKKRAMTLSFGERKYTYLVANLPKKGGERREIFKKRILQSLEECSF